MFSSRNAWTVSFLLKLFPETELIIIIALKIDLLIYTYFLLSFNTIFTIYFKIYFKLT